MSLMFNGLFSKPQNYKNRVIGYQLAFSLIFPVKNKQRMVNKGRSSHDLAIMTGVSLIDYFAVDDITY